ncbi:LmbU family transcriptional regulator [Nocardiopsis dassonvillei]
MSNASMYWEGILLNYSDSAVRKEHRRQEIGKTPTDKGILELPEPPPAPVRDEYNSFGYSKSTDRVSLKLPEHLPLEKWQELGQQIFTMVDSSSWWLGDWLVFGQAHYPDRYKMAIAQTGLSYQTLRNYAWVARQFPVEQRKRQISFQHHTEVAKLSPEERGLWLERAVRFGWSRNELRRRIKASLQSFDESPQVQINVRFEATVQNKALWETAAKNKNLDLPNWIVHVLNDAAAGNAIEDDESDAS